MQLSLEINETQVSKNKLKPWEIWEGGGREAYFDIVCSGLARRSLVLREKLLLLQPLPHHRGDIRMESFLRARKYKYKEVRAPINSISQELQRQRNQEIWYLYLLPTALVRHETGKNHPVLVRIISNLSERIYSLLRCNRPLQTSSPLLVDHRLVVAPCQSVCCWFPDTDKQKQQFK